MHNNPGSSHASFGNSRHGDCSGLSPAFFVIVSMVVKTDVGGANRCPHNWQSAEISSFDPDGN